jgi:catechol 2,3-dioxygenase-like lactoylglutathione lyase family enzyme
MAMPGIQGMEHVGLTVPNLQKACDFFEKVLGAEVLFTAATDFKHDKGNWMKKHLNIHPRAKIKEFRYVRMRNGTNLELFEYKSPDQKKVLPKNSDVGGYHLAFYVDDIYAAVKYLRSKKVRVLGEPTVYTEGPNIGLTWCYFLAPWGLQLEVVSAPNGTNFDKAAKKAGKRRLFDPSRPRETLIK